jgi:hypothetical protein
MRYPMKPRDTTARLDAVCAFTNWSRYYAIGFLSVWHNLTRHAGIESGPLSEIASTIPEFEAAIKSPSSQGMIEILRRAGYIRETRSGDYVIVDNEGIASKKAARKAAGRAGAKAKHAADAKRKRDSRRRRERETEKKKAKPQDQQMMRLEPGATVDHWVQFDRDYADVYGTPHLRNATVNGQMAALLRKLGKERLTPFLQWYLGHPNYRACKHVIGAALKDAEKLFPDFVTGTYTTRQDDRQRESSDGYAAQLRQIERGEII